MKVTALEFYKNGEMKEAFALGGSLDQSEIRTDCQFAKLYY